MVTLRTTFIIDEKGVIEKIITKPDSKNHGQEILGTPTKK
jgi:peroxiredoxin Q/BCP